MMEISKPRHMGPGFLEELEAQLLNNKISAAELTTYCLLPELIRKACGFQKSVICKSEKTPSPVMNFIKNYSWKGHTDRIRRALFQWHQGHYPLVLWNHIPTPLELLELQAKGQRVITVFIQDLQWQETHLGKSAWEFVVHDLIHADHFFENSEWRQGQIEFYQFILSHWSDDMIEDLKVHCSEQFDYLISDMNSHPQHMYQTLSALCLLAWKKKHGLLLKERLPADQENAFQNRMNYFLATRLLK